MNITKRDVQELRRRMKKTECSITRLCGCYVNSGKQIVVKFSAPFLDLEEDEFFKYLEIAKKALSGTLGNNLLELEFARTDSAAQRQQFLLALRSDKLQNEELVTRLFEQVIEQYEYPGNYLILLYHDVYDVMTKTSDNNALDESEEVYEYLIGAVCPVELSKAALGYREAENRIGARERDWIVGLPDLGFVYPAFSGRSSDVNAVMYYVKTGRESHAEFIENVLGCIAQRTAAEDRSMFQSIVKGAFGEDEESADAAFLRIQKNLSEIVAEQDGDENLPPVCLTGAHVSDVIEDDLIPASAREQIQRAYSVEFGDTPPVAQNFIDTKLVEESVRREQIASLEQQVAGLKEQLAEQSADSTPPWESVSGGAEDTAIKLQVPGSKTGRIKAEVIDGQKCLVIPLDSGEKAIINGVDTEL